jgi:transcriptional regulator with XRE-family HTH domain
MDNNKNDMIPQSRQYKLGQDTFADLLKKQRAAKGLTVEQAAEALDITVRYYNELENEVRFCPTGEVYNRIRKVFFKDPEERLALQEAVGVVRQDIQPYLIEFMRKSWVARKVSDILMQLDIDDLSDSIDEDYCLKLIELMNSWAKKRGISIHENYIIDYDDDDDEDEG